MSTDLVLVSAGDRPAARARYAAWVFGWRMSLAVLRLESAFRPLAVAACKATESIAGAVAALALWDEARRSRFAPACAHYGVRRVSARQYRAYRRHVDRVR